MKSRHNLNLAFVIICMSLSTCLSQNDSDNNNSLSESNNSISKIFYVRKGDTAKIPCEINLSQTESNVSTTPKWTKIKDDKDMAVRCRDEKTDDDEFKCGIILSNKDNGQLMNAMLRINEVNEDDFGIYECSTVQISKNNGQETRNQKIVKTVELRDALSVTRRSLDKDQKERSVIVQVDYTLYLYCNYTGVGQEQKLVWYNGSDISITEDLEKKVGLFENFTQTGPYEFEGPASHDHRGFYTCSIELNNSTDRLEHSAKFPMAFTFHVRVREGNRWILPTAILTGEILLLGTLTIFWWRKVESVEGQIDGNYADSDDEDQSTEK